MQYKIEYPCKGCGAVNLVDPSLRGAPIVCPCCGKSGRVPSSDIPQETGSPGVEEEIVEEPADEAQVLNEAQPDLSPDEQAEPQRNRKSKHIKIIGSICAALLLIAGSVFLYMRSQKKDSASTTPPSLPSPASAVETPKTKTGQDKPAKSELPAQAPVTGDVKAGKDAVEKKLPDDKSQGDAALGGICEKAIDHAEASLKKGTSKSKIVKGLEQKLKDLAGTKYEAEIKKEIDKINASPSPDVKK